MAKKTTTKKATTKKPTTKKAAVKKTAKKVVKKILDKTELDEKIVANYKENKTIIDTIICYAKCYGGYVLAVGAGCTLDVSLLWGTILLIGAGFWAYNVRRCKTGTVCKK